MKTKIIIAAAVAASSVAGLANAQDSDARRLAMQVCSSCHGQRGESVSSAFPRLAAQKADYVDAQLRAFRDRTRADPMAQAYMWGMASQLDDATIKGLATYYAGQKPVRGARVDAQLAQQGKAIYEAGAGANAQPCGTCHGRDGEGNGIYPRIAGQHAEYLVKQLVVFKSALRSDPNAAIMHGISSGMSFDQMEAVGAYLASR